ncbi:polysaccharide deacetylase (plasmid) [Salmonella sp. FORC89]|nr:polysaccharide deacetylase [Salmonella sp. FORC89]
MFVLKKSIFAIFYTIQTKQTRIYHQKIRKQQAKNLFIIQNTA